MSILDIFMTKCAKEGCTKRYFIYNRHWIDMFAKTFKITFVLCDEHEPDFKDKITTLLVEQKIEVRR